jgi:RNA polymerase sigma-70 factor, ECF subfamily
MLMENLHRRAQVKAIASRDRPRQEDCNPSRMAAAAVSLCEPKPRMSKNVRLPRMNGPAEGGSRESDTALLIAIGAGDRRALEKLYLIYRKRLARFLRRFTQSVQDIEEIINDTLMVVWCDANDFRFESQVSSWIFGIAYFTALRSIRRGKNRFASRGFDECLSQIVDPALETEVHDWVMDGLNRLPDEQALALQLSYLMGHSLVEIAKITGTPVGTVKARMFHGRQKLCRHLSDSDHRVRRPRWATGCAPQFPA